MLACHQYITRGHETKYQLDRKGPENGPSLFTRVCSPTVAQPAVNVDDHLVCIST